MDPLTSTNSSVTVIPMRAIRELLSEFKVFVRTVSFYLQRKTDRGWRWFESKKSIVVAFLTARRGVYQRPFLHTSFFALVGVGVTIAPLVANSYPTSASEALHDFTPPSAVLSSLDEHEMSTTVSEKPRDSIITHTVVEGDTLDAIADKYGVSVESIKWLNTSLKDDKLAIGKELSIPPVTGVVHKVARGETIYSIAKKYNTDAQNIVNWPFNDFTDLDSFAIAAGQTLIIPDGEIPEAKPVFSSPRTIADVGVSPGDGQFIWPTQGRITSRPASYHMAVDIANNALPGIAAADGGKVVLVERQRYGYGHHVIIDHGNGYQTLYGHMSEIYVSAGQNIGKGGVIGKMGSTGRSTGPHLHFEVRKNGVLLNPLGFLK